jgi:hypothetical protein
VSISFPFNGLTGLVLANLILFFFLSSHNIPDDVGELWETIKTIWGKPGNLSQLLKEAEYVTQITVRKPSRKLADDIQGAPSKSPPKSSGRKLLYG